MEAGLRAQGTTTSRSDEEEDQRERFNVFGHGEEEAPEHHEGEHETPEERGADLGDGQEEREPDPGEAQGEGEARRPIELPEYRGPGRYVEDAAMNEKLRENQEEEAQDEDSFFDDDMSVRSEREVQILHQVGEVQPGPMANLGAPHVPDLQPDQEPEDEREDEQHGTETIQDYMEATIPQIHLVNFQETEFGLLRWVRDTTCRGDVQRWRIRGLSEGASGANTAVEENELWLGRMSTLLLLVTLLT